MRVLELHCVLLLQSIPWTKQNKMDSPQYTNQLDERQERWFAVYTRFKREKLVYQRLQEKGIHAFLPLQNLTRQYASRKRSVQLPLISCYVFTRITKKDYVRVLETLDVVNFVKFSQNLIAIPEHEIHLLQRVVGEDLEVEVDPSGYREGDEVEIIGGNLTGIRGILLKQNSDKNFLIELNHIGYSLRIQVHPSQLRSHIRGSVQV